MNNEKINNLLNNPTEASVLLKTDLMLFIKAFHYFIYRREFIFKDFHNVIIKALENRVYGNNNNNNNKANNLCINIPPRFGKSQIIKYFIAWTYAINKDCNNIYTSYGDDLALKFSGEIKNLLQCELYEKLFNIKIQHDSSSKSIWKVINGGETRASSMGGVITGFGAGTVADNYGGALIIDDPLKVEDGRSEVKRQTCINFYEDTLKSRLNSKDTPIILIMQRIHVNDLVGYLKEKEKDDWEFITCKLWDEETDKLLWEEKFNLEACKQMKETNPYKFYSQYQQEPIIEGGNLIKTEWFRRYKIPPERYKQVYIVCDTAFSEKKTADNSALLLCGVTNDNNIYLLDLYCKKVSFPDLRRDLKSFYQKSVANYGIFNTISSIYIENKGSGQSLLQQLKEEKLPLKELYPTYYNAQLKKEQTTDKYTRFLEVNADLECGYCYIPESSGWVLSFLSECEAFTGTKTDTHDDMVDCLIYALKLRRRNIMVDWKEFGRIMS